MYKRQATMWAAVFADVGVALIAVLNATRAISGVGRKTQGVDISV